MKLQRKLHSLPADGTAAHGAAALGTTALDHVGPPTSGLAACLVPGPTFGLALGLAMTLIGAPATQAQPALADQLKLLPFKIAYESYAGNNWEIFAINADGSNPVNLTQSPQVHEHYPQVSPDGSRICFTVDRGEGRDTVRSLWVMNHDGSQPRHLVDHAREPFWCPDSKSIGFLPQEYPKFSVVDYSTKGLSVYRLDSGRIDPHPNAAQLHHLYNPSFAPNGRWIAATVHAGMGFGHAILLIEANGPRILDLKIPGCRPCISPDGKQIAWGAGDHEIAVAPIDLDAETPKVGPWRLQVTDATLKIYHVDWSPDTRFLSISRGPEGEGDPTKPGTFGAACEMVGVYAPGWNLLAVPATLSGKLDLNQASPAQLTLLTTNGLSNKESAWFRPPQPGAH
jgi:TolB protein